MVGDDCEVSARQVEMELLDGPEDCQSFQLTYSIASLRIGEESGTALDQLVVELIIAVVACELAFLCGLLFVGLVCLVKLLQYRLWSFSRTSWGLP